MSHLYKTLIFDLGKVLVDFDYERGFQALAKSSALTVTQMRARLASGDLLMRFETGLIEPRDFYAELGTLLDFRLDYAAFCEIWNLIFTGPLIPETMIAALATRYRLVLLSNTNAIHFEMLSREYPVLRHFHQLVLSYEVKAMKPRPEIYQAAVAAAQCRPEECFYTDDIAEYVDGARQLGIDAVQFQSPEQTGQELLARGVSWSKLTCRG